MNHLIIGQGEIGTALKKVLKCKAHDKTPLPPQHFDMIHICIPYNKGFSKVVKNYKKRYTPDYVVVHSTVEIGTCEKLKACHSPVTGVHPHLQKSLKTFTKFIGGEGSETVAEELKKYGIPAVPVGFARDTEAGKLFNLLMYGVNILLEKEIYEFCKQFNCDYQTTYKAFVKMYNEGYQKMKMPHIKIYELEHQEGGIGGHCVMENSPMLNTKFSKFLDDYNTGFIV